MAGRSLRLLLLVLAAAAVAVAQWVDVAPQRHNAAFGPRTRYSSCLVDAGGTLVTSHGYFYDHAGGQGPQVRRQRTRKGM